MTELISHIAPAGGAGDSNIYCTISGCSKKATYSLKYMEPIYCIDHGILNNAYVQTRICMCGSKRPSFGLKHDIRPSCCKSCKTKEMIRITKKESKEEIKKTSKIEIKEEPKVEEEKKSRGKNCFKSGKTYQTAICKKLSKISYKEKSLEVIEVEGAKSGPDILLKIKDFDIPIGIEIKNKNAFEGGSQKLKYNQSESRLMFEKESLHSDILGSNIIYEGLNLPYYEGKKSKEDYAKVKSIFDKECHFETSDDSVSRYYRKTGVHYIQIKGYGLFHTGIDILELNVPFFTCKQTLRICTSKHKKNGIPTDVVGDLNYNKKSLSKSSYDLDETLPEFMKLVE